ncbi:MAG: glutaredoxin domain-containing protein [Anaerolineae bacterium]|nr:NrdH-redoxin [Thermoflexales bacterium]MDW8407528.1 glutaredoxin domain-containing protein [Anaerolineae bacterium]
MTESQTTIKFYGAMWCGDTRRARRWFDEHHIPYEWIDVDQDKEAEALVKQINNGFRSIPTIVFADGSHLTEPSTAQLENHARKLGLLLPK